MTTRRAPPTEIRRRSEDHRTSLDDDSTAPMSRDDRGFQHRPVMVAEIVEVFATVPSGVVLDATLGGGGHSEALLECRPDLRILGIDRDPAALAAATARLARFGDRSAPSTPGSTTSTTPCTPTDQIPRPAPPDELRRQRRRRRLARRAAGGLSGALFDLGVSSPQLDRRRAGVLLPPGRSARHAHGHDRAVVGGRRRQRLRRRRAGPGPPRATATSASPAASPGPSSPPGPSRRRPSWPPIVHGGDPGRRPSHRRPPGQAHVPGHPHRGQRRARASCRTPSTPPSTRPRPGPHRRALVPLGRGPHREGPLPRGRPAAATARRACPACAAPSRPSASCGGSRSDRRPRRSPPTRGRPRPGCGSSSVWRCRSERASLRASESSDKVFGSLVHRFAVRLVE